MRHVQAAWVLCVAAALGGCGDDGSVSAVPSSGGSGGDGGWGAHGGQTNDGGAAGAAAPGGAGGSGGAIDSGDSDPFPPLTAAPELPSYVSGGAFLHTYYVSPSGDDASGDGTLGNPWGTINGARTGGSGQAVAAGDLVYFRGGAYDAELANVDVQRGAYYLDQSGTAAAFIVLAAYPGEVPLFTAGASGHISLNIRGDYVVVDGLQFSTGSLTIWSGEHCVIQNCLFEGSPHDPWGDQLNNTHLGVNDGAHALTIRNNTFASEGAHAIKTYSSASTSGGTMPDGLAILHNRFLGGAVSYGLVTFKSEISGYEIAYNRFEGLTADAISIGSSYGGDHDGLDIHHNAFDGCTNSIVVRQGAATVGEVYRLDFHDNLVLNATSGDRDLLELDCGDGCIEGGPECRGTLGELYNNALYGLEDLIDPEQTTHFDNSLGWFNYNAYASQAVGETAENPCGFGAEVWRGSDRVLPEPGVLRTGSPGDYAYRIPASSPLRGAGRDGATIGGFTWAR